MCRENICLFAVLIVSVIMDKSLVKSSGIFYLKSKFFIIRILIYFSFLLIPILSQKSGDLPFIFSALAGVLYTLSMMGQWFFLGKEIDHRLKIYFRVNSSMDRVVYRLFLGMFFFILYFNFLYLFPEIKGWMVSSRLTKSRICFASSSDKRTS